MRPCLLCAFLAIATALPRNEVSHVLQAKARSVQATRDGVPATSARDGVQATSARDGVQTSRDGSVQAEAWRPVRDGLCSISKARAAEQLREPLKIFEVPMDDRGVADWSVVHHDEYLIGVLTSTVDVMTGLFSDMIDGVKQLGTTEVLLTLGGFAEELSGFSNVSGLTMDQMLGYNLMYELASGCTSAVAHAADGTIIHGRTLDYWSFRTLPSQGLYDLSIEVHFMRDGELVYVCDTFVGYVGCLTGMRPGRFSISLNQRYTQTLSGTRFNSSVADELLGANQGSLHGISYLPYDFEAAYGLFIRFVGLFGDLSYAQLISEIQSHKFLAPAYLTVGGVQQNEGAVLLVDGPPGSVAVFHINDTSSNPFCDGHSCLVTNVDSIASIPLNLDYLYEYCRFTGGRANLDAVVTDGRNVTTMTAMHEDVMLKYPTFDPPDPRELYYGTVYATTMSAASGEIRSSRQIIPDSAR